MRIRINPTNSRLLPTLPTPPIRIRHEEQLLLGEIFQAGQIQVLHFRASHLPSSEGGADATRICDILAQCKFAVDVQRFIVGSLDGEVVVLGDEAGGAGLEIEDGGGGPPVCVVPVLVVVATCGVECVRELMAGYGTEGTVAEVWWDINIEDGELHYSSWKDDLVPRWVIVSVDRGD